MIIFYKSNQAEQRQQDKSRNMQRQQIKDREYKPFHERHILIQKQLFTGRNLMLCETNNGKGCKTHPFLPTVLFILIHQKMFKRTEINRHGQTLFAAQHKFL